MEIYATDLLKGKLFPTEFLLSAITGHRHVLHVHDQSARKIMCGCLIKPNISRRLLLALLAKEIS